jgi:CheY-like chemotaxis protein
MSQLKLSDDESAQRISDLLKTADRYVLQGNFKRATELVNLVFDLDANNIYAKAYLQRIQVFKNKTTGEIDNDPVSDFPSADIVSPEIEKQPEHETAEQETGEDDDDSGNQYIVDPETETGDNVPESPQQDALSDISFEDQRKIAEGRVSKQADFIEKERDEKQRVVERVSESQGKDSELQKREENESRYRKTLESAWKSGTISKDVRNELEIARAHSNITDERHEEIEHSVKLNAYINAVKEAWQDGLITPTSARTLEELRDRYSVSIDEHLMIESRIMYELHGLRVRGVVMVIDDDIELSKIIKSILREEGYAPFSVHKPEDGLHILEKTTPDLILLDITFPKPSMSGFTTYEHIRKRPNLRFVPVVFMSGLDEEHIVQLGKKMGADDYIIKPISQDLLVSTVEGKIKRYKEMRTSLRTKEQ